MKKNIYKPEPVEILSINRETDIDWTYRLGWSGDLPRSGQFFQVSVPRVGEAPISASGCGEGWIELTIRNVGQVTNSIFLLKPGDRLHVRGPYGNAFPFDELATSHTVVAAGGTGLAPVRILIGKLVENAGANKAVERLTLLAGFKSPADVLFHSDLETWREQVDTRVTVDRADENWAGRSGVITTLVPELKFPNIDEARVVVVGPPLMMKYTVAAFIDRGVAPEHIWVSQERRMSCGLGKCGHCKIMNSYVCIDGPVYCYADAQWLMD